MANDDCYRCMGKSRIDLCNELGDATCVVESLRIYLYERDKIAGNPERFILSALETYDEIEKERQEAEDKRAKRLSTLRAKSSKLTKEQRDQIMLADLVGKIALKLGEINGSND